ncbi:MAG: HDOD domain-containing protein [Chitinivibrionales bacterium]|nr:HDOD domain-containing protein [Chitinivibrionales bacterium]
MKNQINISTKIENISNLPTLPSVIEKITRLMQNPQTSAEEVGRAITTDQSLASKVLKLVNSAFYGFPGKISTITHAIVILGFSTVKNVVLTASIFDFFKKNSSENNQFDMEKFWFHSLACGAAAQSIARYVGFNEKEECFVGGLIHDIGKIILCQFLSEEFHIIVKTAQQKQKLFYECESEMFTMTHQEIGGIIAEKWNLPSNLQHIVMYHHMPNPSREHATMTSIVHLADILVRAMDYGYGGDDKVPLIADSAWNNLGFQNLSLGPLLEDIDNEIEKASIFMQIA